MAGKFYSVFAAPFADVVAKSLRKAVTNMSMVPIPYLRNLAALFLPNQLRKMLQQGHAVFILESLFKIICKRQNNRCFFKRVSQGRFLNCLWLIRKDCRYLSAEFRAQFLVIFFMGNLYKSVNCFFVQGIHISLIVKPGGISGYFKKSIPNVALPVFLPANPAVGNHISVMVKDDIIASKIRAVLAAHRFSGGYKSFIRLIGTAARHYSKKTIAVF